MIGPDAPVLQLEAHLRRRLHPIETYDPARMHLHLNAEEVDPRLRDWGLSDLKPAAVLTPLIVREAGVSVLLTRRSESLRHHSGQVAFPGGRAEPGETPWTTALREAQEEIGLDPACVQLLGLGDLYATGTGYLITPVVGFIPPDFIAKPDPSEVAEVFETPFSFLMDPTNHEQRTWTTAEGEARRYYAMPHDGPLIWGATAGMVRALYERVFGGADAENSLGY